MSTRGPSLLWLPLAIVAGAFAGYFVPSSTIPSSVILALHAVVIFYLALSLPMLSLGRAVGNARVWGAMVVLNVVAAPLIAFVLSRVVWYSPELQVGVLLVLLAPGVSFAIPVIRGARGDAESVLGVMPLFLLAVFLVVPVFAVILSGGVFGVADVLPTLAPVAAVITIPVAAAAGYQWWASRSPRNWVTTVITPRHTLGWASGVLGVTAYWEVSQWAHRLAELGWLVPLSIAFLVLMAPVSLLVSALAGVAAEKRRAILISSVGRGGLVILPISLTLDDAIWGFVPLVILSQIAIEAVGLMVYRSITPEIVASR